jgi:hypothetical protein
MRRRGFIFGGLIACAGGQVRAATGPVVLELFTSQGCSSCPPADALFGKLSQRPDVIALAWHVDYWNHLGWLDKYASQQATERQRDYARKLGAEVFTPALVVDGANVVVGSDDSAVEHALQSAAPLSVSIALSRTASGVEISVGPASEPFRALNIVYDPEHETDVGAGENNGTRLREYRIVRQADLLAEWDGSARQFTAPAAGAGQGHVVLVQGASLRVVGAAELPPTISKSA